MFPPTLYFLPGIRFFISKKWCQRGSSGILRLAGSVVKWSKKPTVCHTEAERQVDMVRCVCKSGLSNVRSIFYSEKLAPCFPEQKGQADLPAVLITRG